MASQPATASRTAWLRWPRLPERLPDLKSPWLQLFGLLWSAALLLAIVGPVVGTWYRLTSPDQNSALMIGSRAGLALSEDDLTKVRFPVGPAARKAGIRPGDDIIAINDVPIARIVPLSEQGIARPNDATDSDYAAFAPVIEGTEPVDLDIRLRARDGTVRDYRVRTGENHIEQAASGVGLSPMLLSVVDLLHVITYPFLLFAAWVLHRRKREDLTSSILSLAILLTIASEQPSAAFLRDVIQIPDWLHQRLYDLGNIALLAGILLFPYGRVRPHVVLGFIALLPVLFFLKGDTYRLTFILFMAACVMTLIWRLRHTEPGDTHQQIKWALFGFSGYALFLSLALVIDMSKLGAASFASQILQEVIGGLSFGLAFLCLNLGLLVALMRFRLYDAEAVISRSASFALIALALGAVFAAASDGLKQIILNYTGQSSGTGPVVFAAALATVLINPVQARIQAWSENWFQRDLVKLRTQLPECARDMRETASLSELLEDVLARIEAGVRTTRVAAVVNGKVLSARGLHLAEAKEWASNLDLECDQPICEIADRKFPLRVPLIPEHGDTRLLGYILIGPRPDGSVLSKEEQKTLIEVAEPVSRAVRNVIKRERREHEVAATIGLHEARIAELEEKLAQGSGKDRVKRASRRA